MSRNLYRWVNILAVIHHVLTKTETFTVEQKPHCEKKKHNKIALNQCSHLWCK